MLSHTITNITGVNDTNETGQEHRKVNPMTRTNWRTLKQNIGEVARVIVGVVLSILVLSLWVCLWLQP